METSIITELVSALLFKAFEKSGEQLGETAVAKIGSLLNVIREKFKAGGVEGKLTKAQEDPSNNNKIRFKRELAEQMEDDKAFAQKLQDIVKELESEPSVMIFFKKVEITRDAKIGEIDQTITSGRLGRQEAITEVKVDGTLEIQSVKQRQE